MKQPPKGLVRHIIHSVHDMSTSYYSMVMATGILSLAAHFLGVPVIPTALLVLNWGLFAIINLLALVRLIYHFERTRADVFDHLQAPGFFTFVAACAILANQTLQISESLAMSILLGIMAGLAWLLLTYTIFTVLTVKRNKPTLDRGINGGWLLAVVATQSLAVTAAALSIRFSQPWRFDLNFFALSMWLWGGMLYIWLMSLIFYRYTFFNISPADLSPPYWINMGAMAISTLAGAMLIENATGSPLVDSMLPFIKGFTVFYWATGTWWIPMLVLMAIWRHIIKKFPFTYDPQYWGAVFPLGMYSVATFRMRQAMDLHFLQHVPVVMFAMAAIVWLIVFNGQLRALWRQWKATLST